LANLGGIKAIFSIVDEVQIAKNIKIKKQASNKTNTIRQNKPMSVITPSEITVPPTITTL